MAEGKTSPTQVAASDHHHVCKWSNDNTTSARCKGQDQHQRKSVRDAATTFNYNHHHHRPGPTLHDAAITTTCVRAHEFLTNPYTSCSDCCIMLCWSWSVVVVEVYIYIIYTPPSNRWLIVEESKTSSRNMHFSIPILHKEEC